MNIKRFMSISCIGFVCLACSFQEDFHDATKVEEVVEHPAQFAGKRIQFESCFISSRHGISAFDCDDKEQLLPLSLSPQALSSRSAKALLDAGYSQWPPGAKVKIRAKFEGVLLDRQSVGEGFDFRVERISNVTVGDGEN